MDKTKCPLRELKKKQGGLLNKLDSFVDDAFEKVEGGYDKFANWADENIPYAGTVLDVRKFGKEVDELLQANTRTRSAIYAQAAQFKEYFGNLSVSDRKTLFKALDGELGKDGLEELAGESVVATERIVESLPEHLRGLYTKVRQAIDNGANALVEAGALDKDNVITHYIKHYYKKHLEEAQGNAKIAKALSQSKFFKRKDLTWEQKQLLEIEDDAAFAITNTILEQKLQLQKANLLKEFADKFGKDSIQEGAFSGEWVRVSDESVGGGVKKYGALAGKYVPKEIHTALKEAEVFGREMARYNHFYFKIIDHIKVNVTVKNPFTHLYNFGSNMSLAFLHGDFLESMKMFGKAMSRDAEFKKWEKFADSLGLDSHLNDLEGVIKPLKGDVQKGKLRKFGEFFVYDGGF